MTYSRILPDPKFTLRGVNTAPLGAFYSPQLGRIAFGLSGPFWGKFLGQSVGALWLRIFNVNPSKTHRLASSSLTNSELAA